MKMKREMGRKREGKHPAGAIRMQKQRRVGSSEVKTQRLCNNFFWGYTKPVDQNKDVAHGTGVWAAYESLVPQREDDVWLSCGQCQDAPNLPSMRRVPFRVIIAPIRLSSASLTAAFSYLPCVISLFLSLISNSHVRRSRQGLRGRGRGQERIFWHVLV